MLITERKIDLLGRLVLPAEMRTRLALCAGDTLRISFNGNQIILEKI